jgi:FemAB family protein
MPNGTKEPILAALSAGSLDAVLREDDPAAWESVWQNLAYRPVAYSASMLAYENAYLISGGWDASDASLVLRNDGRPCGLWPLSVGGFAGDARLTSGGAAIHAPVFIEGVSPRTIKRICVQAIEILRSVAVAQGRITTLAEQAAEPWRLDPGLTEWHQQLLAAGASTTVKYDLFTDLRPDFEEIRSRFRKSFRPLISVGLKTWRTLVVDANVSDTEVWDEFKRLHLQVSGRTTRSEETWKAQFAMLRAGEAFLVGLRDPGTARLVGAGYFQYTRDEGLYAVAAYDRGLFDKPLGHVVQQIAIRRLRELGVQWYRVGERSFAQDDPAPTPKQVSISAFKQGFASHMVCRFQFNLPTT